MKTKSLSTALVLSLFAGISLFGGFSSALAAGYVDVPVSLEAGKILNSKLIQGENYVIEDPVLNDGLINTYTLKTAYGQLKVESTALLMTRISELRAMTVMEEMDKKKVFGDSVVSGVKAPFQGVAAVVKDPVQASKGIAKGAGVFFSNIGRAIVSDDPHQDNPLKVAIGYDGSKRAYAYELNINPYSSYEPLIDMLGQVSQASVAGGLLPKVVMSAVDSGIVSALSLSGTAEGMRKLVRDNSPGALEKINRGKLAKLGLGKELVEAFLENRAYDPQDATFFVGSLESLAGVSGLDQLVAGATTAADNARARLYCQIAQMISGYHNNVSPISQIGLLSGTPYVSKKDGTAVVLVPVDYIFRTVAVEKKLNRLDKALAKIDGVAGKELWLTGIVDAGAGEMFAQSGWKLQSQAAAKLFR